MPRPGTRRERGYDEEWLRLSAEVAGAPDARCHLCGGGHSDADPLQGDHVRPFAGPDDPLRLDPKNVKPAHRSCNGAKAGRAWSKRLLAELRARKAP